MAYEQMQTIERTSEEWWEEVKSNPELLNDWLVKQYHGEITAVDRILEFAEIYTEPESRNRIILELIAAQEQDHADWVAVLLRDRGIEPKMLDKDERYWEQTLAGIEDFYTGAAVASHAERMRLERIRAIAEDTEADDDIRAVFIAILPQEVFHERAFRAMAGEEAMDRTRVAHEAGRVAIGLIPSE